MNDVVLLFTDTMTPRCPYDFKLQRITIDSLEDISSVAVSQFFVLKK